MAGWTNTRLAPQQPAPGLEGPEQREPLHASRVDDPGDRSEAAPRLNSPPCPLSNIIELEIIPRLLLIQRSPLPDVGRSEVVLTEAHVQQLAELAVGPDADAAARQVHALMTEGANSAQILLDLLTPCARWMGQLWEDDVYDFSTVTIGLWRLQRILHDLAQRPAATSPFGRHARRALLAVVPGAQHTFGVAMAAEFFSRAGWDVACEPRASWTALRSQLAGQWFDLFGLSVSTSDSIQRAASAILDIRRAAANPRLFVMVGGPMAAQMPDLARLCGADAQSSDAVTAVEMANASLHREGVRQA